MLFRAEQRLWAMRHMLLAKSRHWLRVQALSSSCHTTISIGDVTKPLKKPENPELVPLGYLPPCDRDVSNETLKHLKWILQKDLLGQDVFLIGRPGPLRRQLAMQYSQLTNREIEYVALSRDTTESDLKQRREIIAGSAHYIDQSAVRAASKGRLLILEGIEKAERNVLPVLNNLLENREMHLEDGRLLIPADRYDKLLAENGQDELNKWQLVRVSEDFRVIALGLPVPHYVGNPLDPPLRSRFQARDIRHTAFNDQVMSLERLATNLSRDTITQLLSFAHTMASDESHALGLLDFPIENLPILVQLLNQVPNFPVNDAVNRLYPYKSFLQSDSRSSVEDTMATFLLNSQGSALSKVGQPLEGGKFEVVVNNATHIVSAPVGNRFGQQVAANPNHVYVETAYHESLIAELLASHSAHDFCIIGPRGCGKSRVVERLAHTLGYELEPIMLYQDMTARDLIQQRTTLTNGDTVWRHSPLVKAAIDGKMAILDGIHRIHRGTLAVLQRLVHDRELQLYDGSRLLGGGRYQAARLACGGLSEEQMATEKGIFKIKDNFRIVALAEPPVVGGPAKEQWLTAEILSMFLFHEMRALSRAEEHTVIEKLTGKPSAVVNTIMHLTHKLRESNDASLTNVANSLSTRQLVRIAKRQALFPDENIHETVQKACLGRFLPSIPREALEKVMKEMGIEKDELRSESLKYLVQDGVLTIGRTSAKIFDPENKTKIPETLFYDTNQNLACMEAMLQDYLLGEHLLLVGNQGVGKNKLVDRLLKLLNRPREYIQLHRDTTVQSLTLQPTVESGVIVYEDSPLVKAVKAGHILVVDEADKAPTHVTCILKTLVESGEMILSDGRRIIPSNSLVDESEHFIKMHPSFRMIVLANRPGFPFLGNDFFASLGDLFCCHAIDNPSMESELSMLRQYGPDVPEDILRRLVAAFSELRAKADEGMIQYPYSTREVVNIVKHLQKFPNEGLGQIVRNVFDFDAYDKEAMESVEEVLHKHGIPLRVSSNNVRLAKEFQLPERQLIGTWEIMPMRGKEKRLMQLPVEELPLSFRDPEQVNVYTEPLERIEARGLGFSEMHSYWSLPFHDFAIAADVCVDQDRHSRQLFDTIHVATSNPVWLYTMQPQNSTFSRVTLNHFFDTAAKSGGGSWRASVLPRIKLAALGDRFSGVVAVHDEVSNNLVLVDAASGSVISVDSENGRWFRPVQKLAQKLGSNAKAQDFFRMRTDFAKDNKLLFYTPHGNTVQLVDLSGEIPMCYKIEIPMRIESLYPLNENQYLVVAENPEAKDRLFLLKKETKDEKLPSVLNPIAQRIAPNQSIVDQIEGVSKEGLSDFGLRLCLKEAVSSPNSLFATPNSYASIAMGFPDLEFSANEVYAWPKDDEDLAPNTATNPTRPSPLGAKQFVDNGRNLIFLRESCQIVSPVSAADVKTKVKDNNYGLSSPGNVSAFLQVVDLMSEKIRYIPVPEPAQMSVYASWYKQTYPDQILSLSATSNEGLVSVDNSGTVRLWETGVANLSRSINEWKRMIGDLDNRDLMIMRDQVGDINAPKHGQVDPTGAPHVGGNTWAGGTGGRDTAGMGGVGGPYRLDAGHDVHQVPDDVKAQVPEHVRKAAREMNRKAYEERLREIKMSEFDARIYEQYSGPVRKQVQALKNIINSLQAKAKDRQWLKNQTQGELDDTRLIEGITGEKSIYKKRGEQEPELGAPQEKPKRLRLLVDVSGSMYRFNGHDHRLERMMESALMVMEALDGYSEKIQYDIVGHSGEENGLLFTKLKHPPRNENERLGVIKSMHAHSQFCMSGDHTLSATALAINELSSKSEDYDESFVIVLSDANFDRYGISPSNFGKILTRNSDQVCSFAIFIGSLGDQADRLTRRLPAGKAFVCLDTKRIPEILKTIFTSTIMK